MTSNKPYDDSNWREDYKQYTSNKRHLELLENGPKQLSQAWLLGALHNEWKRIKGYVKLDRKENEGQLQSSMKEWEESVKKYQNYLTKVSKFYSRIYNKVIEI